MNGLRALWRGLATAGLLAAIVWGSLGATDDTFPIGPFHQYARADPPNGRISVPYLQGRTGSGPWKPILFADLGLRRAEIEGQLGLLQVPVNRLLPRLANAYATFDPGAEAPDALRLMYKTYLLQGGRAIDIETSERARWTRS